MPEIFNRCVGAVAGITVLHGFPVAPKLKKILACP
jgi:hypothetical protein